MAIASDALAEFLLAGPPYSGSSSHSSSISTSVSPSLLSVKWKLSAGKGGESRRRGSNDDSEKKSCLVRHAQTKFVSVSLNSASTVSVSSSEDCYRLPRAVLAIPPDPLRPSQVAKVGLAEDLVVSISDDHRGLACDVPTKRAIFNARPWDVDAGVGLVVGASVKAFLLVRFRPFCLKLDVSNHLVCLTLHSIGSRRC